jgi:hypothetical protein
MIPTYSSFEQRTNASEGHRQKGWVEAKLEKHLETQNPNFKQ